MRVFVLICTIISAALTTLAAFGIISTMLERTDRESLIGAFFVLCFASPFALIAASLSLVNRRKWPLFQVVGSLSVSRILFGGMGVMDNRKPLAKSSNQRLERP